MHKVIIISLVFITTISIDKTRGQNANYYLDSFSKCTDKYFDSSLKTIVFYNVDVPPNFPGGQIAYLRYINKELKYPVKEIDLERMQSCTMVDLIVGIDGQISNPKIILPIDQSELSEFEIEFLRIINKMPKWEPGKCKNKIVPVIVRLSLRVCLADQ